MKKILSMILAFCFLAMSIVLVSCKHDHEIDNLNGKSALDLITNAEKQMNQSKNYHITFEETTSTEKDGVTTDVTSAGEEKRNVTGEYFYTATTGSSVITNAYVDGIYYRSNGAKKEKYPLSKDEFMAQTSISLFLASGYFKDAKFKEDGDNYTTSVSLEGEGLEYIGKIFGATCTKAEYSFTFKEGGSLLKAYSCVILDYGTHTKTTERTTNVVSFATIEISAPADADTYTLIEK